MLCVHRAGRVVKQRPNAAKTDFRGLTEIPIVALMVLTPTMADAMAVITVISQVHVIPMIRKGSVRRQKIAPQHTEPNFVISVIRKTRQIIAIVIAQPFLEVLALIRNVTKLHRSSSIMMDAIWTKSWLQRCAQYISRNLKIPLFSL